MTGGAFAPGDRVQLTDPKGRQHTLVLRPGGQFHTHHGSVSHDDLLGRPEGVVVHSAGSTPYLALRPLLRDRVLSMPRGAAVVYPKDAAIIVGYADVFPGARVVEAGVGSGALTCSLLRAVGPGGRLVSYERRAEFAEIARGNVEQVFGGPPAGWQLRLGEAAAMGTDEAGAADRVVLDMLAPWEVVPGAAEALVPGGVLCCYVATTTQLARTVEALHAHGGFTEPEPLETLLRPWHVEGLAVRPGHRMIGHTGFLVLARRLAPGVSLPPRRRRPAKAAQGRTEGGAPTLLEVEEAAAEGWWAPQTAWLGRWLLRAGEGFTGRANSALPLGPADRDLPDAVAAVVSWYRERGLPPTIAVPFPLAGPAADALDRWLAGAGWTVRADPARVMTAPVAAVAAVEAATPVSLDPEPDEGWLGLYRYRGTALPPVARQLLLSARWQAFASVRLDGRTVAVGRVAGGLRWAGITAMQVAEEHRRRGLGRAVLAALAAAAAGQGAESLYLQVAETNAAARALYRSVGFTDSHRYHYRVAPAADAPAPATGEA